MFFKSKERKIQDHRCLSIAGVLRQQFEQISTLGQMLPAETKSRADDRLRSSFTTGYLHAFINMGLDSLGLDDISRAKLVLKILPQVLPSLIAHADQDRLMHPDDLFEKGVLLAENDYEDWAENRMPTRLAKYIIQGVTTDE